MINVDDAIDRILATVSPLETTTVPLRDALQFTLAHAVLSPIQMPPFDNSAMDGYAIYDWDKPNYSVIGEVKAGDNASHVVLKPGEAVRIFTGAMVPTSATTVVKQEITDREETVLQIKEEYIKGSNIRHQGEQIEKGALALDKGTRLDAAAIGFLAMLGVSEVEVYRKPNIHVLITGNELVAPGAALQPGQIYESNALTLVSALKEFGCNASITRVEDDFNATKNTLKNLLEDCDILLSSGGISVGDYDFVGKALFENNVHSEFYKVKQKPGKPLFYGTTSHCRVFALPGNPASALTCLYLYVLPSIRKMMGYTNVTLEKRTVSFCNTYSKSAGLTHFLKGSVSESEASLLKNQSSSMLNSFAQANCLIRVNEEITELKEGDPVTVYMLP